MSKSLYGQFTVSLADNDYTLIPTLEAVRKIESRFGGLRPALDALQALSVEGTSHIIAAGANLTAKQTAQLQEEVFAAGIGEVTVQVVPYVVALLNPGKSRGDEAESGNAKADVAP